jgi:hypothetical protein
MKRKKHSRKRRDENTVYRKRKSRGVDPPDHPECPECGQGNPGNPTTGIGDKPYVAKKATRKRGGYSRFLANTSGMGPLDTQSGSARDRRGRGRRKFGTGFGGGHGGTGQGTGQGGSK